METTWLKSRFALPRWQLLGAWFGLALAPGVAAASDSGGPSLGASLPIVSIAPFVLLLLSIAIVPLVHGHWWEKNRNKAIVVTALSIPLVAYLLSSFGAAAAHILEEQARDYLSFIVLLLALFTISGGVLVQGSLSGTPIVNTGMLAFGAALASVVGTTGASMLLIRPLLRANAPRERKVHIVIFFIFIVSNCGGLLTPLGDPPLFLGFLKGVPFEWTLLHLWPQWLTVNLALLVIFNIWDQVVFNREELERPGSQLEEVMHHQPLRVRGLQNLAALGGVVATIYCSGRGIGNGGERWPFGVQEGLMVLLTAASYFLTPRRIHEGNRFGFGPIIEVAVLFVGIFVTMTPALAILNAHGTELGIRQPWQFFWTSGALSSFLDNAPTYQTFAAAAAGLEQVPLEGAWLADYLALPASTASGLILAAISCGAVFMGANSYIGNGPNFMVKAIAEENGVKMPSFFGYLLYSASILLPLFAVITLLFFR